MVLSGGSVAGTVGRFASVLFTASVFCFAAEWPRFRGPNGSGVAEASDLPAEIGPEKNVAWKTGMLPGYSSPVVKESSVFVTAYDGLKLYTLSIDRRTGKTNWRVEAPKHLTEKPKHPNSPASPSPVTDGRNVYVFFDNFGLVSYGPNGKERWRHPLGPFNLPYGSGSSPVLASDTLVMLCDQDSGSFLLALDKDTGKQRWRTDRSEFTHGFSSPVIYWPAKGPAEIIVSGSYQLAAYDANSGRKLWWVNGMAWQAKSVPVIHADMLYVHSWMASLAELGHKEITATWEETLKTSDKDGDGFISQQESQDPSLTKIWFLYDLDKDDKLGPTDWKYLRARSGAKNGLYAIRPGGRGDVTDTHVVWRYEKGLPNIPSPLHYKGVLYLLREGGILTSFDPANGSVLKQARIEGAIDAYFAAPVAGDNKIITASKDGKVAVIKPGAEWEIISVNSFEEEIWATPAIAGKQLFIRTQKALYCFEKNNEKPVRP
jgi:outer membrane protein assembly factor BamB